MSASLRDVRSSLRWRLFERSESIRTDEIGRFESGSLLIAFWRRADLSAMLESTLSNKVCQAGFASTSGNGAPVSCNLRMAWNDCEDIEIRRRSEESEESRKNLIYDFRNLLLDGVVAKLSNTKAVGANRRTNPALML